MKRIIIASDNVEDIQRIKDIMPASNKALVLSSAQSQEIDAFQEYLRKQTMQRFNECCTRLPLDVASKITKYPMSLVNSFDDNPFIQELK